MKGLRGCRGSRGGGFHACARIGYNAGDIPMHTRFRDFLVRLLRRPVPVPREIRYDWVVVALSAWLVGGAYIDGWAHNHLDEALETFFTPWHAILYSGFLAMAAFYGGTLVAGWRKGGRWMEAIPSGYRWPFLGVPLFMMGGIGDMIWHLVFGIEKDVEALLSPMHLLLAISAFLLVSGPFLAARARPDPDEGATPVVWAPAVLSLAFVLSLVTFMTQFDHPLAYGLVEPLRPKGPASTAQSASIGGILLYAAFLTGFALTALRRRKLPPGAMTVLVGLNAYLMATLDDQYRLIAGAVLAGVIADLFIQAGHPSAEGRVPELRFFSFLLPFAYVALYFASLFVFCEGVWWPVHMWAGAPVMAGLVGLMTSFVAAPPRAR